MLNERQMCRVAAEVIGCTDFERMSHNDTPIAKNAKGRTIFYDRLCWDKNLQSELFQHIVNENREYEFDYAFGKVVFNYERNDTDNARFDALAVLQADPIDILTAFLITVGRWEEIEK